MTRYLLAIQQPQNIGGQSATPPDDLDDIMRDVDAVRQEMIDAGVWVFSGGLADASTATCLRPHDGDVLVTDGPYAEAKEQIGGLTILDAVDLDAALEWGRKLTRALRSLPVEVRPFLG